MRMSNDSASRVGRAGTAMAMASLDASSAALCARSFRTAAPPSGSCADVGPRCSDAKKTLVDCLQSARPVLPPPPAPRPQGVSPAQAAARVCLCCRALGGGHRGHGRCGRRVGALFTAHHGPAKGCLFDVDGYAAELGGVAAVGVQLFDVDLIEGQERLQALQRDASLGDGLDGARHKVGHGQPHDRVKGERGEHGRRRERVAEGDVWQERAKQHERRRRQEEAVVD